MQRVWSYAHILKDDGLAFMDYTEQITYLLFLKMADETSQNSLSHGIPSRYRWAVLRRIQDDKILWERYHQGLRKLSEKPGLLGLIFTKPQSKITDPAKLRLLIDMIDTEDWSALDADVKGDVYEGLLARNAEDVRGGAGQYFTPRPVINAIVRVMRPTPTMKVSDPACGTGGFLLAAYAMMRIQVLDEHENRFLHNEALRGADLVPNVARLCAMNLYLHGIGVNSSERVVSILDSLAQSPTKVDMVLTNPPFGKRSSIKVISENGSKEVGGVYYRREDFWATTKNKQLNFLQHIWTMLNDHGRAAVVVPDNVLFEGGAGEKIRRNLLTTGDLHTLLRLPTGIWYSPGVKANVLFFNRNLENKITNKKLWIYDLRSGKNFTLRENPLTDNDLADFISCYQPEDFKRRNETERFKCFSVDELLTRDRANLDITWIASNSDRETKTVKSPQDLASAILEDLRLALNEFSAVEMQLNKH